VTASPSRLHAALVLLSVVVALGCPPKRPPAVSTSTRPSPPPATLAPASSVSDNLPSGPDILPVDADATRGETFDAASTAMEGGPLDDVLFDYDSAALNEAARSVLEKHAFWMQNNRSARLTVEGHCDERGSVDYNLALGNERAKAARDYLVSLGVGSDRLTVVSLGKERPLDSGRSEAAYARNRPARAVR
jgi:peptidoglycan-associated lipoprotein